MSNYPRDMKGYGRAIPDPQWPGDARIAVQLVLNYEEGAENCVLHGDPASESFLSEMVGTDARPGVRHLSMESLYEYGTRVGVWRLRRLFETYRVPVTVFAVGMAVERYPDPVQALHADGHEICSHGYRWIDYQYVDEATEREHVRAAVAAIERAVGERPRGWYTGRSGPNTRRLVVEEGGSTFQHNLTMVVDGVTGRLVRAPEAGAFAEALRTLPELAPGPIRAQAERFSHARFAEGFVAAATELLRAEGPDPRW